MLFSYQLDFIGQRTPKRKRSPVYGRAVILLSGFLVTTSVFKPGLVETNEPRALRIGEPYGLLKHVSKLMVFCFTSASRAHQLGLKMIAR